MMSPLKFIFTDHLKQFKQDQKTSGFTLIELLVAMILAALVITPLLGFMIDILSTDRKEQAKSSTEQNIKTAIDYIDRDLQQAIYIYDYSGLANKHISNSSASGIQDQLPSNQQAGCGTKYCIPVLVFWKREPRPQVIKVNPTGTNCPPALPTTSIPNCNDAYVYSLVGYYLIQDSIGTSNTIWSNTNTARIARFEVSDGVSNANPVIQPDPGFNLFTINGPGTLEQKMNQWTKDSNKNYTSVNFNDTVLVDYIDSTSLPLSGNLSAPSAINCDTTNTNLDLREQQVPTSGNSMGFYACVNSTKNTARVYIRGNAKARIQNQNIDYTGDSTYFPTATIQVKGNGSLVNQQ